MNLPGYGFARSKGYKIVSYSSDRSQATYAKYHYAYDEEPVYLIIRSIYGTDGATKLEAKLEKVLGLIICTTGWLGFPHPNFDLFEDRIVQIIDVKSCSEE